MTATPTLPDPAMKPARTRAPRKAPFISAEEFARKAGADAVATYQPTAEWERKPATRQQLAALKRAGVDPATVTGRGHAKELLGVAFEMDTANRASAAQRVLLAWFGPPCPEQATVAEFHQWVGQRKNLPEIGGAR